MFRKMSKFLKPPKVVVDDSTSSKFLKQEDESKLEQVEECVAEKELDNGVRDDKEIDSFESEASFVSFSKMSLGDHVKHTKTNKKEATENMNKSKTKPVPDNPEAVGAEGGAHAPESHEPAGNRVDTPRPRERENEGGCSGIQRSQSFAGLDSGSEGYWVVTYLERK